MAEVTRAVARVTASRAKLPLPPQSTVTALHRSIWLSRRWTKSRSRTSRRWKPPPLGRNRWRSRAQFDSGNRIFRLSADASSRRIDESVAPLAPYDADQAPHAQV